MAIDRATMEWRLIRHPAREGAWNMAADEAILLSVAEGKAPPTLRLYAWEPACLSLGRAQPYEHADHAELSRKNWEIVRRPTGGRAILHHRELTYAVIAAESHPLMQGGVLDSYRRISAALVKALEILAIPVEVQGAEGLDEAARTNPICFEVPSAYEITVAGRKVLGSAQVRKRRTVLQHGSLPLAGDLTAICDVLRYPDERQRVAARRQLQERAVTLEQLTGSMIDWDQAAQALQTGFERALGLRFSPSDLTPGEVETLNHLRVQRYRDPNWTRWVAESAS